MGTQAEKNACSACARSKRKCGRQTPSCARCAARGASCVYPPSKSRTIPSSRLLLPFERRGSLLGVDDGPPAEVVGDNSSGTADQILADYLMLDLDFPLMDSDLTPLTRPSSPPATKGDWFLAPETWSVTHRVDTSITARIGIAAMKRYVTLLQSWFQRWATNGSTPFIHPRLYSTNFPACLQVAYATLISYIHRTLENVDMVLQIVEDRATDLLLENGAVLDAVGKKDWTDGGEEDVDLFTQLARLHALMVYQIIGVFDGDIRARYVAEGRMAVQDSWARKLFRSAGDALSNAHTNAATLVGWLPQGSTDSHEQWYLWILSESIRRTFLIAISIFPVYAALQQRWAICPGSIMYTNRSGPWDAASATEWEKLCSEKNVALLRRFECVSLLDEAEIGDMDEFGMAMLDMTYQL